MSSHPDSIILVIKHEGETPLACLERLRVEKGIASDVPMTYAGRLDPMASGLLLILVGDECKNKDGYLGLDKEYEVEVLLGISTDTGDILGLPRLFKTVSIFDEATVKEKVSLLEGTRTESYPLYSSKPVNGKPLFAHAREGTTDDIELPEKEITIYSADFDGTKVMSGSQILSSVESRIQKVIGDFRQEEILETWRSLLSDASNGLGASRQFTFVKVIVRASSGAYMRTFAEKLGSLLGTDALAWTIVRTQIGDYSLWIR